MYKKLLKTARACIWLLRRMVGSCILIACTQGILIVLEMLVVVLCLDGMLVARAGEEQWHDGCAEGAQPGAALC